MSIKDMSAIVLAAGQGKRMRSTIPKVLHPVTGLPMVLLVVDTLKKAGINRIVVVSGGSVKEVLPGDVSVVEQGDPLGTGHAVMCTRPIFSRYNGDLLIACADMPLVKRDTVRRLISSHRRNNVSCTIMTGVLDEPSGYGRIIRDSDGNVVQILEDSDSTKRIKGIKEVNSGMYCFKAKDLFNVLSLVNRRNKQKEFYLTDTIEILIKKGYKIKTFCVEDSTEILGINSRKDLAIANRHMNQRILEMHMANGVTIVDPNTTYVDIRARIGRDAVIYPFTVIEGNVAVGRHCEVGPFTHLRDKTVLKDGAEIGNFVEVKKSSIGRHTKAKHLTYLGDTTVGERVNIGAGTITANYDGKNKYPTVIKDRAFIGTHTTLVAPVTVGRGAVTGAGAVVLRNRDVPPNTVVVGVPAKVLRKKPVT